MLNYQQKKFGMKLKQIQNITSILEIILKNSFPDIEYLFNVIFIFFIKLYLLEY